MESNSEASCISDPNFAVICAFLERFASTCGITYPPFLDLQEMLENMEQVPQELVDLHIILLRKARRSVFREKWEKALVKFCQTYSAQDGWEIERFGYKNSRLEVKLRVLKALLEGQFDLNCKFKTAINTLESTELRSKPLGKDKHGKIYWLQVDPTSNIRVYREDPDDETWALVAKDRDSLVQLLQELTADEESLDVNLINEDSSISVDIEKTILDTGQEICNDENYDFVANGDIPVDEKDPLEIKDGDDAVSEVKTEESQSEVVTENGKRVNGDAEEEGDLKRVKMDEVNGDEVGEAIEDPVMHVYGEGNGAECDAGNPDKEDNKSDEKRAMNPVEQTDSVSSVQTSSEVMQKVEVEIKPQPKLWSIDAICGTGNLNHSTENSKPEQKKNFSSFSIESVLEKKTDAGQSSGQATESPVISVNTLAVNNSERNLDVTNIIDRSDRIVSVDNLIESTTCNVRLGDAPSSHHKVEEDSLENMNEIDSSVPIAENYKNDKDSTVCAENIPDESGERLTETKADEVGTENVLESKNEIQLDKPKENEIDDTHKQENKDMIEHVSKESDAAISELNAVPKVQETTFTIKNVDTSEVAEIKIESNEEPVVEHESNMTKSTQDYKNCIESINTNESDSGIVSIPQNSDNEMKENIILVENEAKISEDKEVESVKEEISLAPISAESSVEKMTEELAKEEVEPPEIESSLGDATVDEEKSVPDDAMNIETEDDKTVEPMEVADDKDPEVEESTMKVPEIAEDERDKPEEPNMSVDVQVEEKSNVDSVAIETSVTETEKPVVEDKIESFAIANEPEDNEEPMDIDFTEQNKKELNEPAPAEIQVRTDVTEESKQMDNAPEEESSAVPELVSDSVDQVKLEENTETSDTAVEKEHAEEEIVPDVKTEKEVPEIISDKMEAEDEAMEVSGIAKEANMEAVGEEEMKVKENEEEAKEEPNEPCSVVTNDAVQSHDKEPTLSSQISESLPESAESGEVGVGMPKETPVGDEAKPAESSIEVEKEELGDEKISEAKNEAEEVQVEAPSRRKIETRRTSRAQKQSAEENEEVQTPARATRSGKKSVDEDLEAVKEVPVKTTRKRRSQDISVESDAPETEGTPAVVEEKQPEEADSQQPEENLNSTANSISDENSAAVQAPVQEERTKVVRRRKKRGKKSRIRKSIEVNTNRQENSSEDEKKPAEGDENATNEEKTKKKITKKPKDTTPRTRQLIPERELKLLGISNMEELPTVRQSRRIAQLKMKEEAERNRIKKLEEEAAKEEEEAKKRKKKKKKKALKLGKKRKGGVPAGDESYEEEEDDEDEDEEAKAKQEKKKRKKKDKLVFNELNPWISSTESSTADEEEDEIEDEPHEDEEILFKSDHEFSPESDIEDPDYKPIKRARTAKVDPKEATEADSKYDDTACEKCGEKDHPEWILLCDKCDKGWHASCVRPALMVVPEGDWFCPPCEHISLVQKLRESLVEYDRCQKQRENEELRKKRLAFVGISLDNVLPAKKDKKPKPVEQNEGESDETASENASEGDSSSSGSSESDSSSSEESDEPVYQLRERRSNITSYRYNEYDELIKSALQEEIEAVKGVGLGKGKDITNQAGEYDEEEKGSNEEEDEAEEEENGEVQNEGEEKPVDQTVDRTLNPHLPKDIMQAKPRIKSKKDDDEDYEADTDAGEGDEYNQEENEGEDEEEEELVDELPPVVPRYDKKKKKSRSLNVRGLDFTSDEEEEDNSDSDFKGESSEEESEYSMPSESESSDGVRRHRKNYDGPVRRSTRARTARYDREFINDDSEDESPRRKRSRNVWIESESSDSDRSWGKRKKRGGRSGNRSAVPKKKTKTKARKKKKSSKKKNGDSDNDYGQKLSKKVKNPKIKYGGLDDLDDEPVMARRTRGKKINYQEMNASDSDDEVVKKKQRMIVESDEEFVAEKEKSDESEDDEIDSKGEANGKVVSKKLIMQKTKKKRKMMPDSDDLSDEDLLEDEELDEFADELADLDEEEGDLLGEMLRDGNVPIHELKEALRKLRERRKAKAEIPQTFPPIPDHMENPGSGPKFPKIGKMKITPSRAELAAQLGMTQETIVANMRNPGLVLGTPTKEALPITQPDNVPPDQTGMLLMNEQKETKDSILNLQPPPYPFPPEAPPSVPTAMVNPMHQFPVNSRPPIPPFNSFQGIIGQPPRLPPEYPHTNIPTTVLGIDNDALRNQGRKPPVKTKRKNEESLSPQAESGEENSGDGRIGENLDSSPKRRGRGRGKKQLLAESQAKQELGISTVQAPTQFPPQGLPPEGGSVITRMLNTPQGPQPFADFGVRGRPPATTFRPPYSTALRPPLTPPATPRLRAPAPGIFHASHPLDPSSSAINLPQTKPSPLPPGFPARPPVLPRYPADLRPPFPSQSSPSRSETYPYPNFYGPFPPGIPNSEDAPFHNPNFPNHPFDEHHPPPHIDGSGGPSKVPYDEEGGEFGGLASYFASQREDDLDT